MVKLAIVGVTMVGDVPKTAAPVPVSSLMTPASWAEVVDANCESGLPVTPHVAQAIIPDALRVIGEAAATARMLVPELSGTVRCRFPVSPVVTKSNV